MTLRFDDLFSLSWEEMNCGQAVAEGLRRLGMMEAADHIPTDQETGARLIAAVVGEGGPWALVGEEGCAARRVGDVISFETDGGWHVSVVVDGTYVLSSSKGRGPYLIRRARLRGVTGVYRWEGAA
jgi:hypothetical protein